MADRNPLGPCPVPPGASPPPVPATAAKKKKKKKKPDPDLRCSATLRAARLSDPATARLHDKYLSQRKELNDLRKEHDEVCRGYLFVVECLKDISESAERAEVEAAELVAANAALKAENARLREQTNNK